MPRLELLSNCRLSPGNVDRIVEKGQVEWSDQRHPLSLSAVVAGPTEPEECHELHRAQALGQLAHILTSELAPRPSSFREELENRWVALHHDPLEAHAPAGIKTCINDNTDYLPDPHRMSPNDLKHREEPGY